MSKMKDYSIDLRQENNATFIEATDKDFANQAGLADGGLDKAGNHVWLGTDEQFEKYNELWDNFNNLI